MVFELGIVPLVVERATEDDLVALERLCHEPSGDSAGGPGGYTMEMSAEFHVRTAACTHNPAIEMLVGSFHGPLLMSLEGSAERRAADGPPRSPSSTWSSCTPCAGATSAGPPSRSCRTHVERTATRVSDHL